MEAHVEHTFYECSVQVKKEEDREKKNMRKGKIGIERSEDKVLSNQISSFRSLLLPLIYSISYEHKIKYKVVWGLSDNKFYV